MKTEEERKKHDDRYRNLQEEVRESFVRNMMKTLRVAGGIDVKTKELKNLGKGELAEKSRLSTGTITKCTSVNDPNRANPDLETLCKLGHALNVSPAFLLMTPRDWDILLQAMRTMDSLMDPDGDLERHLYKIVEQAANKQKIDEMVLPALDFMTTLNSDSYEGEDRERQRAGILIMTAMAQDAVRLKPLHIRTVATALGALLGDREVTQE